MLHTAEIIHCDFTPRNTLLDAGLDLKVADFGCVSIDGYLSSAGGDQRFYPTAHMENGRFEPQHDIFALGSSIYEVLTAESP